MIDVILCDDHAILRRGIRDTLTEAADIRVVGEAASYSELRELLRTSVPQILLLDINMPGRNGLEILASVKETHPEIRVLMVSMYPEDQYALRCLKAGAHGYANKAGNPEDLIIAVRTIAAGRKYLTAEVAQLLAENVMHDRPLSNVAHETLSEREMQTLQKLATGQRLTDIAEELMISPKTVSVYRARVLEKLSLSSNAQLTAYAIEHKLI